MRVATGIGKTQTAIEDTGDQHPDKFVECLYPTLPQQALPNMSR
jgi:hypothetical protein